MLKALNNFFFWLLKNFGLWVVLTLIPLSFANATFNQTVHDTKFFCVSAYSDCVKSFVQHFSPSENITDSYNIWFYYENLTNNTLSGVIQIYNLTDNIVTITSATSFGPNQTLGWHAVNMYGPFSLTAGKRYYMYSYGIANEGWGGGGIYGTVPHIHETFSTSCTASYDFCFRYEDQSSTWHYPDQELAYSFTEPTPPPASIAWASPPDMSTATSSPVFAWWLSNGSGNNFYIGYSATASSTGITEFNFGTSIGLKSSDTVAGNIPIAMTNGECYLIHLVMLAENQYDVLATSANRTLCLSASATSYGLVVPSPVSIPYTSYVPLSLQQMGITTPTIVWTAMTGAFESFLSPIRQFVMQMPMMNTASATASALAITTSTVGMLAYVKFGLQIFPQLPFASMLGWLAIFFVIFGIFQLVRLILLKR